MEIFFRQAAHICGLLHLNYGIMNLLNLQARLKTRAAYNLQVRNIHRHHSAVKACSFISISPSALWHQLLLLIIRLACSSTACRILSDSACLEAISARLASAAACLRHICSNLRTSAEASLAFSSSTCCISSATLFCNVRSDSANMHLSHAYAGKRST